MFKRNCSICLGLFETKYSRQNICSFKCRMIAQRERSKIIMRIKRNKNMSKEYTPCEVCGFKEFTEIHHERDGTHNLCKNHHSLITRGIYTFEQLMDKYLYHP